MKDISKTLIVLSLQDKDESEMSPIVYRSCYGLHTTLDGVDGVTLRAPYFNKVEVASSEEVNVITLYCKDDVDLEMLRSDLGMEIESASDRAPMFVTNPA